MQPSHVQSWARPASPSGRRSSYFTLSCRLALSLLVSAAAIAGCSGNDAAPADSVAESTAHAASALSSTDFLFAVAGSQLEQGAVGGTFTPAGDVYGVTAMAGFHGNILVASGNKLWQRGAIGPETGNDWTSVGNADGAVAMTYHQGQLYMVAHNQLWQRSSLGPGTDWTSVGEANSVTAMASLNGRLYVTSNNKLWQRGAIGPGTGNDWTDVGDAYGVTAMATYGGHLYVVSNNQLWQRGAIGPGTGNDWSNAGSAPNITALTSLPVNCSAGFSAADCPSSTVSLAGLVDVAVGHPVIQSSTLGTASPSLAVDGDITTIAATNIELTPWVSVDLTFDRTVEALGLSTDTSGAIVELVDASGTTIVSQPLTAFTRSNGMYILKIAPVTARSVRVRASSAAPGVSLHVGEVQTFAQLVPSSLYPITKHVTKNGACWKSTYTRGAGAPISTCDASQDQNGALCYPKCSNGYYGVGPVCWQSCPSAFTDTGAFCHRDGSIISADNSACPWYDKCGLTLDRGCSACPAGYANDGCTCRIDPQDFAKGSYGRGAGAPLHCSSTQEEQAALCYTPCSSGYDGVGPVCWGECHGDYNVACGSIACASSSNACTAFVESAVDSTIALAINVGALVATWGAGDVPFTYTIETKIEQRAVKALTEYIANRLVEASQGQSQSPGTDPDAGSASSGQVISQAVANSTAGALVTAIQTGSINWTLLDPTGIYAVIAAFNQPIC